jgi:endo-1,4-beta-xylanase
MKWQIVEPAQGVYDWTQADELVNFAHAHGQLIRGHAYLRQLLADGVPIGGVGNQGHLDTQ